jgi:hypothetical protein
MILGRTPEGLIKTKSDGALGLRAVNCACCSVACGCYSISIPLELRSLFETANLSNLSAFGVPAAFFGYLQAEFSGGIENDIWYADFTFNLPEVFPILYLGMGFTYQKSTGCLSMGSGAPLFSQIEGYVPGDIYDYDESLVPEVTLFDAEDPLFACQSVGYLGSSVGCSDPEFDPNPIDDTFTINGSGSFAFWYLFINSCAGTPFPPLNIVLT